MTGNSRDEQNAASVVVIRNGTKLCAKCRDKGCERFIGGIDSEVEYVSDEPCQCCGPDDFEVDDGFGI